MTTLSYVRPLYTQEEWVEAYRQLETTQGLPLTPRSTLYRRWAAFKLSEKRSETNRLVEALQRTGGAGTAGNKTHFRLENELRAQTADLLYALQSLQEHKVGSVQARQAMEKAIAETRGTINVFVYENKLDTRWMSTLSARVTESLRTMLYAGIGRYRKD